MERYPVLIRCYASRSLRDAAIYWTSSRRRSCAPPKQSSGIAKVTSCPASAVTAATLISYPVLLTGPVPPSGCRASAKPLSEISKDTSLPPSTTALTSSALSLPSNANVAGSSFTSIPQPAGRLHVTPTCLNAIPRKTASPACSTRLRSLSQQDRSYLKPIPANI